MVSCTFFSTSGVKHIRLVNGAPPFIDIVVSQTPDLRVGKSAARAGARPASRESGQISMRMRRCIGISSG